MSNTTFSMEAKRPDQIDRMVFTETFALRRLYIEACIRLDQKPRNLTPVTLMQRSVPE